MQKWNMRCIAVQSAQGTRATYGIVQRTESDWVANGIRLDGGRNLIGRRTETSGDVPPTDAPTKQTERVSHRIRRTHRTFWQRKPPTDRHRCTQIRRVWHPCHTHAANQGVQLSLLHKQNRWHVCSVGALLARLVHLRQVHPLRGTNFCVDL